MSLGLIEFLFWLAIIGLATLCIWLQAVAKRRIMAALTDEGPRRTTKRERAILEDMKNTRLALVNDILNLDKPYPMTVAEMLNEDDGGHDLDKFNASKTKRKQKPSSRATRVVKSKRGRK